jgi:LysR family transcriptional regulator, regulator of abg operon
MALSLGGQEGCHKLEFLSPDNRKFSVKLQHLRALVAIAESGSVRAAARSLGLTQPALSKALQQIEEELSVSLVSRTARGVTLTNYGSAVLARARGITQDLDRLREEVEQMRGSLEGGVAVAISPSPAMVLLPDALRRFHQEFPAVQVRVRESVYPETLRMLREGQADLAVGAVPKLTRALSAEFHSEVLYGNALVVCCRKGHPTAGAKSLSDLLECQWLQHGPGNGPGSLFSPAFRAHDLAPPVPRIVSDSYTASFSILEHSDMLCLLPERIIRNQPRLTALSLRESMPQWDVSMIHRSGSPLTPAAQAMATALRRTPPRK